VAAFDLWSEDKRGFDDDRDPPGLGLSDTGVTYGESCMGSRSEFGETPPVEYRSRDEMEVMLLPIESTADDAKEPLCRLADDADETDPCG
jgi:hypothetical protein